MPQGIPTNLLKRVKAGDGGYPADHFNSLLEAVATIQQTIGDWGGDAQGIDGIVGRLHSRFPPILEFLPAYIAPEGPNGEQHAAPQYWVRIVPSESRFQALIPWGYPDLTNETQAERQGNVVLAYNLAQVKGVMSFDPSLQHPIIVAKFQRYAATPGYVFYATSGIRWVSITTYIEHAPNVWNYRGIEVRLIGDSFEFVPPGTEITNIFNTMEMRNPTGRGVMGNGVDTSTIPSGFDIGPVRNCVVPLYDGNYISVPNPIVGSC